MIGIGVPTVVDAATIVHDSMGASSGCTGGNGTEGISGGNDHTESLQYVCYTEDVDETVKYLSFTISEGLNIAFSQDNPKKNIIGLSERGDPVSKVRQVLYLVLECCILLVSRLCGEYLRCRKMYSGSSRCIVFWKDRPWKICRDRIRRHMKSWWRSIRDILERWCVKKIKMRE